MQFGRRNFWQVCLLRLHINHYGNLPRVPLSQQCEQIRIGLLCQIRDRAAQHYIRAINNELVRRTYAALEQYAV